MLILNLQADFDTNLPNFFDGLTFLQEVTVLLRPTIVVPQEPQSIDTTIRLNFNQSCLEPDQIPQSVRQSMRSLPDDSQLPLQTTENQSSMVKEKKQAVKKHVCPEQGCPKSITGYTQSHNLKDHIRKKHNSI